MVIAGSSKVADPGRLEVVGRKVASPCLQGMLQVFCLLHVLASKARRQRQVKVVEGSKVVAGEGSQINGTKRVGGGSGGMGHYEGKATP